MIKEELMEKVAQNDLLASVVRLFYLSSLLGISFGTITGLIRLNKIKETTKKILNEDLYSSAGGVAPELAEAIADFEHAPNLYLIDKTRPTETKNESNSQAQNTETSINELKAAFLKKALTRNDLSSPEKWLYDLANSDNLVYGSLPILFLISMPLLSMAAYHAVTNIGLKWMIDKSKKESEKQKEQFNQSLSELVQGLKKEGQNRGIVEWLEDQFQIGIGFSAALAALIFFVSTPVFYQIFKSRQAGSVKDFVRRKAVFQKLPSAMPVQLTKEDFSSDSNENAEKSNKSTETVESAETVKNLVLQPSTATLQS